MSSNRRHALEIARARPQLPRRTLLAACAGAGALLFGARSPRAAEALAFPTRAVRIVVPYSVGVGPDVVARCVAEQLAQRWGTAVLVENRPGASGIVAFGDVRRTPPDGHTLFLADTATLVVNPLLHDSLPYDPSRDLVPLTMLFRATFVIWVGGTSRHRDAAGLIDSARREPGRVSYGSLGHGHASQVAIETLARAARLHLLHVPFTDAGSLFAAVASGEVDFTAFSLNSVAGLMASGRLRPLAVASSRRLPGLPQVPTLAEAGGPPVEMHPWAALVTVAGTLASVLERLQRDLAIALASDEVRGRTERAGFELTPSTPQAVLERMRVDRALYAPLVSEGRIART
jgi:tripartite-type tricarboxylate transporter receptor subunit TctC